MIRHALILTMLVLAPSARADDEAPLPNLDLTGSFHTAGRWTLTATRGAPTPDPIGMNTSIPGIVTLCLATDARPGCSAALLNTPPPPRADDPAWLTTRNVDRVGILSLPVGDRLLVQSSGPHSANDSHWKLTQVLSYDRHANRFSSLFARTVGSNNNQEIRLLDHGPLAGDIVIAEPTSDAPFGYWITLEAPTPTTYRQVLHFRSATRYGDSNPLAVIDAEMPGFLSRLGKPHSMPNTSPDCPAPHLHDGALWCTKPG